MNINVNVSVKGVEKLEGSIELQSSNPDDDTWKKGKPKTKTKQYASYQQHHQQLKSSIEL